MCAVEKSTVRCKHTHTHRVVGVMKMRLQADALVVNGNRVLEADHRSRELCARHGGISPSSASENSVAFKV